MKQLLLISACAALALPASALAQHPGWGGHGGGGGGWAHGDSWGGPHFAAGGIDHFGARDLGLWRGGHWFHGPIGGRFGWWWWADGFWYWYDGPVYPYPLVVGDVYEPDETYAGPSGGGPPPEHVWFYCSGPRAGYYPYVRACPSGWQTVPATPPDYQPQDQGPQTGPDYGPPPQQGPPMQDQGDQQQGPPPDQGPPPPHG